MKQTVISILVLIGILQSSVYGQRLMKDALPYKREVRLRDNNGVVVAGISKKTKVGYGKVNRTYSWLSRDSIRHSQGVYQGVLLHGPYRRLYPNGNIRELGSFKEGLKSGKWIQLDPNGVLRRKSTWKQGEETGKYELYAEDGSIKEAGRLRRGVKHGIFKDYDTASNKGYNMVKYRHGALQEDWNANEFSRLRWLVNY